MPITEILNKPLLEKEDIKTLLQAEGDNKKLLFDKALQTKLQHLDNYVHLRGLIEYSNICTKYCLYCGVRSKNPNFTRYQLSDEEVIECAKLAHELGYGSVALQSGERSDKDFTDKITHLVKEIKKIDNGSLGVTLSLGEQTEDVYKEWFEAGAHRYLLRIEASNEELYYKIHPHDAKHDFKTRLNCIDTLLKLGYQTGTGVMVGLPFQSLDDLADDLLFFRQKDVAMVGMGPFIPHPDTPLWQYRDQIPSAEERMELTLKMIAILRLMMPEINMVAATANQTVDPMGREKAIAVGANVIMPNLTPNEFRENYLIYPDKACVKDKPDQCQTCLDVRLAAIGHRVLYNEWGDSKAFTKKIKDKRKKIKVEKTGKYEFTAEPFHCDFSGHLCLGHLGNNLLNAADFHATGRGFGMKHLLGIHRAWVLSRLAIEMDEMPEQLEHFNVETWIEGAMRYFTQRNFAITGTDGKVYGYGRSVWAMIDTETRQMADIFAIEDGAINQFIVTDKPCPIEKGDRVKMGPNAELVRTIDVYYHDIDINGHVNSIKYIEHVIDLWDIPWYTAHRIKRFDIAYVAETHQGDKLSFYREQTGENTYCVRLVKTDQNTQQDTEVCRVKILFT